MRKVNRRDILKIVLILAMVAGTGLSMAAIGRFTPTHAIVEPVYCGACHPDQVIELNKTTHLPHFANAVYGQANDRLAGGSEESTITKAEAISGGCMMCHNSWDNRKKFFVTGYKLSPVTTSEGDKQYILQFNDIVTYRSNKSTRYNVAVTTASVDQKVTLATVLNDSNIGSVIVSSPGAGTSYGTVIAQAGNYTVTASTGQLKFLSSSGTMTNLSTDGASVDIGQYNGSWKSVLVKLPSADGQVIYLPSTNYLGINGGSNPTNVVVATNNSFAAGIDNGTVLGSDNYTITNTGIVLNGSSNTVKALSGNKSTININATVTMRDVAVRVGMTRFRLGTNVSNVKVTVQNPGTSGLAVGDILDGPTVAAGSGTDFSLSFGYTPSDEFATYIIFSATSAKSNALSAGKGSVRITYNVDQLPVDTWEEVWADMSILSPNAVGAFIDDKTKVPSYNTNLQNTGISGYGYASCGNPEKGLCHIAQNAVGIGAANMMQENQLLTGASGNGIYFQHEMAYTSAQYAAKQVKLCGVCHVNKLPPMEADGTPMRVEASDVPQVSYHGTFQTDTSIVTSDWAHRGVQCIRCHGHAGIGTEEEGTGVQSS